MLEDFTPRQAAEQQAFIEEFLRASPDFQSSVGYEPDKYQADMLKLASKYVGHAFKCVSLTLEMPFKDNADLPDAQVGWNGARSKRLGQALLQPILRHVTGKTKPGD
jgi:murein tripeptide amidase MpaA